MTHVCPPNVPIPGNVPDLALAVHAAGEEEVAGVREEEDGLDAFRVTRVLL